MGNESELPEQETIVDPLTNGEGLEDLETEPVFNHLKVKLEEQAEVAQHTSTWTPDRNRLGLYVTLINSLTLSPEYRDLHHGQRQKLAQYAWLLVNRDVVIEDIKSELLSIEGFDPNNIVGSSLVLERCGGYTEQGEKAHELITDLIEKGDYGAVGKILHAALKLRAKRVGPGYNFTTGLGDTFNTVCKHLVQSGKMADPFTDEKHEEARNDNVVFAYQVIIDILEALEVTPGDIDQTFGQLLINYAEHGSQCLDLLMYLSSIGRQLDSTLCAATVQIYLTRRVETISRMPEVDEEKEFEQARLRLITTGEPGSVNEEFRSMLDSPRVKFLRQYVENGSVEVPS